MFQSERSKAQAIQDPGIDMDPRVLVAYITQSTAEAQEGMSPIRVLSITVTTCKTASTFSTCRLKSNVESVEKLTFTFQIIYSKWDRVFPSDRLCYVQTTEVLANVFDQTTLLKCLGSFGRLRKIVKYTANTSFLIQIILKWT